MNTVNEMLGLYPGSFDTPTNGHVDLIRRSSRLFDRLVVAVANNASKNYMLTVEQRVDLLTRVTESLPNVSVTSYAGLTVDYARRVGAAAIVRGLRAVSDFDYELQMALMNQQMAPEIEIVFLAPSLDNSFLSSTMVREVLLMGGDIARFVPPEVEEVLRGMIDRGEIPRPSNKH